MDEQQLVTAASKLVSQYADRVSPDVLDDLREYDDVGEPGELISVLIAHLANTAQPITPAERDELAALAEATGEGGEYLSKLKVSRIGDSS